MELVHSLYLALMASPDKPLDVLLQHGPPEAHGKTRPDRENPFVTELVMRSSEESIALVHMCNYLVSSAALSAP